MIPGRLSRLSSPESPAGAGQAASFGSAFLNLGEKWALKGHGNDSFLSSHYAAGMKSHLIGKKVEKKISFSHLLFKSQKAFTYPTDPSVVGHLSADATCFQNLPLPPHPHPAGFLQPLAEAHPHPHPLQQSSCCLLVP